MAPLVVDPYDYLNFHHPAGRCLLGRRDGEEEPSLEMWIAVRNRVRFTRGDERTQRLVQTLLEAAGLPQPENRQRLVAVCVAGHPNPVAAAEVSELTDLARERSEESFRQELCRARRQLRCRYKHLEDLVEAARPQGGEVSAWQVLQQMRVLIVRLEPSHEEDWAALLGEMEGWSRGQDLAGAVALRSHIEALVGWYNPEAAQVGRARLCRDCHPVLDGRKRLLQAAWSELRRLESEARGAVRDQCGHSHPVVLPRDDARQDLETVLMSERVLMVSGVSGTGKSALVCSALDHLAEARGGEFESVYLNLRHLPQQSVVLRALLAAPLGEALAEMSAPRRLVVIDAADIAAETDETSLAAIVTEAAAADASVCVVAATEASETVRRIVAAAAGVTPRTHTVPALTDGEIDALAAAFPALGRMAASPRARELLRRPVIVDHLARAGISDTPLSEGAAMEVIWSKLVRGEPRQGQGSPDSRDQAMRRLAHNQLAPHDPDVVYAELDGEALAGLNRDGILRAARPLGAPLPDFAHDILRDFAVAKVLTSTGDPAGRVAEFGVPRWALPIARLACEALLSRCVDAEQSPAGVFDSLQAGFDDLASRGHSERWGLVAAEALLGASHPDMILKSAWPALLRNNSAGLRRLLGVLRLQHRTTPPARAVDAPAGSSVEAATPRSPAFRVVDMFAADAVVQQLLDAGTPPRLDEQVSELISDWLFVHVMRRTPAGHPTRAALADKIIERCRRRLAEAEAELARDRAPRGDDPESHVPSGPVPAIWPTRRRESVRPYQWIDETSIGHLGRLGADLSDAGEAALRTMAQQDPHYLQHAVDPPGNGQSLAHFSPALLADLVEAYYIDDRELEDLRMSPLEEGVRRHVRLGMFGPSSAYYLGPFLAMLYADFRRGIACINRLLNHAARARARMLLYPDFAARQNADIAEHTHMLSVTGEPRPYVGDSNVWRWYRGAAVGAEPCMSALQALEFVSDQHIRAGASSAEVASVLLESAESLAMVGLVTGILIRHIETDTGALDPFLAEPLIWRLERDRAFQERIDSPTADVPDLSNLQRRMWTLRHVAMVMLYGASGERIEHLRQIGQQLVATAAAQTQDDTSQEAQRHLAEARAWAAALDRDSYQFERHGNNETMSLQVDPATQTALAEATAEQDRLNSEYGLINRHTPSIPGGRVLDTAPDDVSADIAAAKSLISEPSNQAVTMTAEAVAAVAASAIETHFGRERSVAAPDLRWSAEVIISVAPSIQTSATRGTQRLLAGPLLHMGAACSIARGLPYLLLPAAAKLRRELKLGSTKAMRRLTALNEALATYDTASVRLAYARSLDAVWAAPCNSKLASRCHHRIAFKTVSRSYQDCVAPGPDRRKRRRTSQPTAIRVRNARALSRTDSRQVTPHGLTAAMRALGSAAVSGSCCQAEARRDLLILLDAHQRTMIVPEFGFDSSDSCSLVAARAALQQAAADHHEVLVNHVLASMPNAWMLAETLRAVATAAEENQHSAAAAQQCWPLIMDAVMDAAQHSALVADSLEGRMARAALIPNPPSEYMYQTRELANDPHRWADLLAWTPQVERWLAIAPGDRESIDQLVVAVRRLEVADQVDTGLRWIETLVQSTSAGAGRGSTWTLAEWLQERQPDLETEQQRARWQNLLDMQVVSGNTQIAHLAD